jgi:hypothetical protein
MLPPPSLGAGTSRPAPNAGTASNAARFRLFRLQPGFLRDPIGLEQDDDPPPENPKAPPAAGDDPFENRLQVAVGNDNPFFDFRRRGDPGGVGFYKLNSQLQLLDTGKAGVSMNLQAWTPAGLECDGVANGPTTISPALGCFYALDDGTALHGFVGKHVRANGQWGDNLHRSIEYGLAVQRPLSATGGDPNQGVYFFVEALGRYRYDAEALQAAPVVWEVLPGLHWRLSDAMWLSGGVSVPLRSPRPDGGLLQITASWQF